MDADWSLSFGNIIEMSVIAASMIAMFTIVREQVRQLRKEVGLLEEDVKALNKIIIQMAVADRRLFAIEETIRELKHGRGFIREDIEGEWPRRKKDQE